MSRAPSLLNKGGAPAANRAADALLARANGKTWRWPRVQGVQVSDDADTRVVIGGDPLELLLALEEAAERLARGDATDEQETLAVQPAARRAHRSPRSVQLAMARRARAERGEGQMVLPGILPAASVYKTRRRRAGGGAA